MALNEIQMKKFSEGSFGTGGRVDELTLPVDIPHRSRSEQAHANEKDLDLELNLQKENFGAGPASGSSSEDDELVHPVSESRSEAELVKDEGRVAVLEPIREEDQDDGDRTHQPVGDPENWDHTVTVEESDHICRICGPDEEITEPDNLLVDLGCHCRGDLSRMHRKCILQWYGPRYCWEGNYQCELCNALLHGRIEDTVRRALFGHRREGDLDILVPALVLARSLSPTANVEAPTLQAHGNADPDSHQINIEEITHPAQRPDHPIWPSAPYRPEARSYDESTRGGYTMCVVVSIILVLIGFAVAGVGKLS